MKLDSKYFDMVRASKRARTAAAPAVEKYPPCQWRGCQAKGVHRAPLGRGHDGEFYIFCVDHIREYNQSYNYFNGMSDSEVESYHQSASYGDRPTWKLGSNAWAHGKHRGTSEAEQAKFADARVESAGRFAAWRARNGRTGETPEPRQRTLRPLERKALDSLNLTQAATGAEIKTRYKELVKRHHPDANGGDRASEDKLREIIQAYNYLKQAGLT